jgi:hypothetical protein
MYISSFRSQHTSFCDLQVRPDKICSQLGLCLFNGAQYARLGSLYSSYVISSPYLPLDSILQSTSLGNASYFVAKQFHGGFIM